jgi:hypothetical protein
MQNAECGMQNAKFALCDAKKPIKEEKNTVFIKIHRLFLDNRMEIV